MKLMVVRDNTLGTPLLPEEGATGVRESSNVLIEEKIVDLITTKHAYTASLKTIKAKEEVPRTLFDVLDR